MTPPQPSEAARALADKIEQFVMDEPCTTHYGGGETETTITDADELHIARLIDEAVGPLVEAALRVRYPPLASGPGITPYITANKDAANFDEALKPWRKPDA